MEYNDFVKKFRSYTEKEGSQVRFVGAYSLEETLKKIYANTKGNITDEDVEKYFLGFEGGYGAGSLDGKRQLESKISRQNQEINRLTSLSRQRGHKG
ncbi:MAG: hypothetical protein WC781_00470 [Candidatus Pacearchaeota archaeon]|jgi:hypothetical protein